MKDKLTETKYTSPPSVASQLIRRLACLGTVILTCCSAAAENLFVSGGNSIYKFNPNGVRSTFASGLSNPGALAFDHSGNLFVVDGNTLLKFIPGGLRLTFASGLGFSTALAIDRADNVFVAADGNIYKFTPDGMRTTFASGVSTWGLAFNSAGLLFAGDHGGGRI